MWEFQFRVFEYLGIMNSDGHYIKVSTCGSKFSPVIFLSLPHPVSSFSGFSLKLPRRWWLGEKVFFLICPISEVTAIWGYPYLRQKPLSLFTVLLGFQPSLIFGPRNLYLSGQLIVMFLRFFFLNPGFWFFSFFLFFFFSY